MKKFFYSFTIVIITLSLLSFNFNFNEKEIKNFKLKGVDNKYLAINKYKNAKGFIIVFICNRCPMAKFYSERLNNLNKKYQSKNVYLLAINAMDTLAYAEESFKLMQKTAKQENFNFPYLQDKKQIVGKQFNASHTPQAFVIWKNPLGQFYVKYQGAIDDNAGDVIKAKPLLANAIEELLNNKNVSIPKTESFGCRIFYRGEKAKMD
jgi:peroxiredoxin